MNDMKPKNEDDSANILSIARDLTRIADTLEQILRQMKQSKS